MKKIKKYVIALMITICVFWRLGNVLEANYDGNQAAKGFYALGENTADVMFYGSSRIYAGVDVAKLWKDHGIAAFNHAGTMQTLWNSYYNMVETLKYQKPKVMVVDIYGATFTQEYSGSTNVIKNVSSMRFSVNKIENVWNSVPHEDFLSYMLKYPLMHDAYREVKEGNYHRDANAVGGKDYKGFIASYAVTPYDTLPQVDMPVEKKKPMDKNVEYLDKMINLAKTNNVELAFIAVPAAGFCEEDEAVFKWVEDYAKEKQVSFLDANRYFLEMGFNPGEDFAEGAHLNYNGACKFTDYLGDWLLDTYDLPDHRGEMQYASWQNYSDAWDAQERNQTLRSCGDLETYLQYVKAVKEEQDYTVLIGFDDNYKADSYVALLEESLEVDVPEYNSGGVFVLENDQMFYCTPDEPDFLWVKETPKLDIVLRRKNGDAADILVNGKKMNENSNDITILVYDSKLDVVADVVAFNGNGILVRKSDY